MPDQVLHFSVRSFEFVTSGGFWVGVPGVRHRRKELDAPVIHIHGRWCRNGFCVVLLSCARGWPRVVDTGHDRQNSVVHTKVNDINVDSSQGVWFKFVQGGLVKNHPTVSHPHINSDTVSTSLWTLLAKHLDRAAKTTPAACGTLFRPSEGGSGFEPGTAGPGEPSRRFSLSLFRQGSSR